MSREKTDTGTPRSPDLPGRIAALRAAATGALRHAARRALVRLRAMRIAAARDARRTMDAIEELRRWLGPATRRGRRNTRTSLDRLRGTLRRVRAGRIGTAAGRMWLAARTRLGEADPRRSRWGAPTLVGSVAVVGVLGIGAGWSGLPDCESEGCPEWGALKDYRPPEAPHYYDRDGRLVGHLPGEVRVWVPLDSFPALLPEALVAVEDRRFREHRGLDLRGIARAIVVNVRAGGVQEGASTLSMQLARNLWWPGLEDHGRWRRKAVETRLALRLEQGLDKDGILEQYLNRIYLGSGVYGFGAAAHHYYGKGPADLTVAEIATLVGAVKTPERYNPRTRPDAARERRDIVLAMLERDSLVDGARLAEARADTSGAVDQVPVRQGRTWFASAVSRELREIIPDPEARSGVRVYATLDPAAQRSAERRLAEQIARIESGEHGRFEHPVPGDSLGRAAGDSEYLQGAVVAIDARTGAVRAVVGGRSFEHSEFDRAFLAARQPGSAFKPLVYAAALGEREITLADRIDTNPVELTDASGVWTPADAQVEGDSSMIARQALARSSNWAAVRVGAAVGSAGVAAVARALGIVSRVEPVPASYLGASVLRPVELVTAYAAFANGGSSPRPHLISRIEDRAGRVIHEAEPRAAAALDPRVAFLTREALRGVVDGGTGWRARRAGYRGPAAGKTGTTDAWRDAWFVGFNGELVTGVWFGFDRPRTITRRAYGGTVAAPVWGAIMADLYGQGRDAPGFPDRPDGLRSVLIDPETGFALSENCPADDPRFEYFIAGTEPPALCEDEVGPRILLSGTAAGGG